LYGSWTPAPESALYLIVRQETVDTLGYFEKLKAVGVPEEQAKVQANAMREHTGECR
jgi:hypothetical protein